MKLSGNKAVLRNRSGNVRNPPMANTVSELLVLMPIAKDIPDQASPKNAMMKKMSRIPMTPVFTKAPKAYANPKIIAD
jgi:hypothetical protein